jgi:hypothetical protein
MFDKSIGICLDTKDVLGMNAMDKGKKHQLYPLSSRFNIPMQFMLTIQLLEMRFV